MLKTIAYALKHLFIKNGIIHHPVDFSRLFPLEKYRQEIRDSFSIYKSRIRYYYHIYGALSRKQMLTKCKLLVFET